MGTHPKIDVTARRSALLAAAGRAAAAADAKSPVAITRCVALDADRMTGLRIRGTDLYVDNTASVDGAEVASGGELAVDAKGFVARLKALATEDVRLTSNDKHLIVKAGSVRYQLSYLGAGDMPASPARPESGAAALVINGAKLAALIRRVSYAASRSADRQNLACVRLIARDGSVVATAADGHLVATIRESVETTGGLSVLVPIAAIGMLERELAQMDGDVELSSTPRDLFVQTPDGSFLTAIRVDQAEVSSFPPIESYITPRGSSPFLRCGRVALISAIKAVSATRSDDGAIEFSWEENGDLRLYAQADADSVNAEVPCEVASGSSRFAVLYSYMLNVLSSFPEAEVVEIQASDELSPVFVRAAEGDDRNVTIAMPMTIKWSRQ